MRVLYTFSCSILHTLYSTGFKSGDFGGHSCGEMNCGVSFFQELHGSSSSMCWKRHFDDVKLTSLLLSVVQVVVVLFIIFLVNRHVNMNCARNCENLLNFVKVMPKILLVPFFSGHGVVPRQIKLVHCGWWSGCYIWYNEEGTERGRSPPRPLLAVPNVTDHPSTASVPITVFLYNGPLLGGLMCPLKG